MFYFDSFHSEERDLYYCQKNILTYILIKFYNKILAISNKCSLEIRLKFDEILNSVSRSAHRYSIANRLQITKLDIAQELNVDL